MIPQRFKRMARVLCGGKSDNLSMDYGVYVFKFRSGRIGSKMEFVNTNCTRENEYKAIDDKSRTKKEYINALSLFLSLSLSLDIVHVQR